MNVDTLLRKYAVAKLQLEEEQESHLKTIGMLASLKSGAASLDGLTVEGGLWQYRAPATNGDRMMCASGTKADTVDTATTIAEQHQQGQQEQQGQP